MIDRRMGSTGVQLSALSLGSWVTYHNQVDAKVAVEMMAAAYDAGVTFFDNAEAYAGGRSEEVMGAALKTLAWAASNPHVSSVITGASKLSQLQSNLGALDPLEKLTPAVRKRIDKLTKRLAD